ncbi:uncharacterized protein [Typha latifolia]|uniref:uncharacterized protein isoform X1 n=2 Tax=Typha latifolia TaxID=4733 RepID=UPI003C308680
MEYERIHKVQMGVISPSKLKMKLLGSHGVRKKEGASNSSRASPSKLEDMEHSKNSLLAGEHDEDRLEDCKDASTINLTAKSGALRSEADTSLSKAENTFQDVSYQLQPISSLSTVHPVRSLEEGGNGYDSCQDNGSTHSFEFHREERTVQHAVVGPFVRPIPSKWNDAEKWLVNRNLMHPNPNVLKKAVPQNQGTRQVTSNLVRVVPESLSGEQRHHIFTSSDIKKSNSTNAPSRNLMDKFSFVHNFLQSSSDSANGASGLTELSSIAGSHSKNLSGSGSPTSETTVSMRDVGTEMTPIASQEQSRSDTPIAATTPTLSPLSSMPSTPKRGAPTSSPAEAIDNKTGKRKKVGFAESSDRELQLKIKREIAALGMQLGKVNIASWASKDDAMPVLPSFKTVHVDQPVKKEYQARAAEWEESQKSKHVTRFKHEEIKIQAWESHQKAKLEAKVKRVEAKAEQMKARAQQKMAEKLTLTRRKADGKQAIAEARRNRLAARLARQVEQIRRTGRVPTPHFGFCGWFF